LLEPCFIDSIRQEVVEEVGCSHPCREGVVVANPVVEEVPPCLVVAVVHPRIAARKS